MTAEATSLPAMCRLSTTTYLYRLRAIRTNQSEDPESGRGGRVDEEEPTVHTSNDRWITHRCFSRFIDQLAGALQPVDFCSQCAGKHGFVCDCTFVARVDSQAREQNQWNQLL